MKQWLITALKLLWAAYFLLTSLYCILAIPPYTFYAFIKAPPYDWLPVFVAHHVLLYWIGSIIAAIAYWPGRRSNVYLAKLSINLLLGLALSLKPFLPFVQGNTVTFVYAVISLVPVLLWSFGDIYLFYPRHRDPPLKPLGYPVAIAAAIFAAISSAAGIQLHDLHQRTGLQLDQIQMAAWSLISHITLAIAMASGINILRLVASKSRHAWTIATITVLATVWLLLTILLNTLLQNSISLPRMDALIYAPFLAFTTTIFSFSLLLPLLKDRDSRAQKILTKAGNVRVSLVIAGTAVCLMLAPVYIDSWDWNGTVQGALVILVWSILAVCFGLVFRSPQRYSLSAILAIVIITAATYEGLKFSAILWGKSLGATDDEVARKMEEYTVLDSSFLFTHRLLGNIPKEVPCGDFCHVLREYTNIPQIQMRQQANLVDNFSSPAGDRPNIFIFVIDSMRPDYLGPYNRAVDFTPNLNTFAADSVVFRNAYTQYAGTTLSEPAIWSGAMLLHSHYQQPFSNVNNLEKLVTADAYKTVVSYDTVLKQMLSPNDSMVRLDTDKHGWKNFEVCSTIEQLTNVMDSLPDKQPVFFYSQPMNVHQLGQNPRPHPDLKTWNHPGFVPRISMQVNQVDECLGGFFSYLKRRGLFDNSIVVITSDHGDATGELGRISHALIIYPEVMHVPLIIHLPKSMQHKLVYDEKQLAALTDITPSLDYILGNHDLRRGPVFGHSLFAENLQELQGNARHELFMASDVMPVFGIMDADGKYLYTTYASPAKSEFFDLVHDPTARKNILTPEIKQQYDQRIIEFLKTIGDFYGYKPGVSSFLASGHKAPN